jgi:hypothetical protein
MRICILANPRTGSSSLYTLLEKHLPKNYHCVSEPFNPHYMESISDTQNHCQIINDRNDILLKHIYYQLPPHYETMDEWLNWLTNNFDKIILLDRRDRVAQAESFEYHQSKNFFSWHVKQFYNITSINTSQIQNRIKFLNNDGECLRKISGKYPMFFYEDIFVNKNINIINSIFQYMEIEPIEKYVNQYIISDNNKVRITKDKQTLI